MSFIVIPHIEVQRANALATPWAITMTPVFAYTMFAHAIGCDLDAIPDAVAIIHHDAQFLAETDLFKGFGFYPHQFRGSGYIDHGDYSSKNKHALSLQPTASMNTEVSLVLFFEDSNPSIASVSNSLRKRHLAGGLIISNHEPRLMDTWSDVLQSISSGFILTDQSFELSGGDGRISRLIDLMYLDKGDRWLSPSVLGYAAITPFESRKNARDNAMHAFAEPLMGLIEFHSIRKLKDQASEIATNSVDFPCFWVSSWLQDDVFVQRSVSLSSLVS